MLYNYIGVASVSSAKFMVSIPVNVGGTLSYNGSVQSPTWDYDTEIVDLISGGSGTSAGTYQAVFRFKNPDKYMWADKSTGDKAIDWMIERAVVTTSVPSQSGTLTYNGSVLSPTWTSYDTTQLQISGQITGTDAGTYEAIFTPTDNYKWSDGTLTPVKKTWSISYAKISYVPSQSRTLTYTGSSISPQWSNYDDTQLIMDGVTSGVNAGPYVANFTPTTNYTWSDGTKDTKDVTWTISRATIANIPSQSGSLVYTGNVLTPTWENYDPVKLTIGGTTEGTSAGNYTATFTPTSNYQWSNNTTTIQNVSWSIQKASSNVSVSSSTINLTAEKLFEEITVSWHGAGTMSATSSDTTVAVVEVNGDIVKVSGVKTGSATVTISVNGDDNHTASSKTVSVESTVPQMYTVTINLASGGEGAFTGAGKYAEGDRVTLNATPATDYRFAGWKDVSTGDIVSTDAEYSFVISSNVEFEAVFKSTLIQTYTINAIVSPNDAGTVSGAGIYEEGQQVTVTANLNEGYNFKEWQENSALVSENNPYSFIANANRDLIAKVSKSRLPSGYTEVEYIECTNGATIDTGVKPKSNTKLLMDFEPLDLSETYKWLFYSMYRYSGGFYFEAYISSKNIAGSIISGGSTTKIISSNISSRRMVLTVDSTNKKAWLDDEPPVDISFTSSTSNMNNIFLFNSTINGTNDFTNNDVKLYSTKIFIANEINKDFVPCISPDKTVGLYDIVYNNFYSNANSQGIIIAGPKV